MYLSEKEIGKITMNKKIATIVFMLAVIVISCIPAHTEESPGELPNDKFAIRTVSDPDVVVRFFSDLQDVTAVLGNPLTRNDQPTDFTANDLDELAYDGLLIAYVNEKNAPKTVVYMRVSNDRYETVNGVRVGMERDAVIALNGPPLPGFDQLLSEFNREHGTSVMRYSSERPYAPGGWYLIEFVMDEDDRVAHIIFTISVSA
jgi:hypothetical protein